MAEVENVPAATSTLAASPTEIVTTKDNTNEITISKEVPQTNDGDMGVVEYGTSPTQEPSSNSHPHDSEYDTASDLEGVNDYDDDNRGAANDDELDDEDDEDEDDDETETSSENNDDDYDENIDDEDAEDRVTVDSLSKTDDDITKKVDEDRRNPQYIPKRGTFYEHDDRMEEMAGAEGANGEETESKDGNTQAAGSQSSNLVKKWTQGARTDRWRHDRFNEHEQTPKSRSELVNSYGYDIRSEDNAPKARRHRRYGRGPTKYLRNWEDEGAYMKAKHKERRLPRPSDFPALDEKLSNQKVKSPRQNRENKENRLEKRLEVGTTSGVGSEPKQNIRQNKRDYDDRRERRPRNDRNERHERNDRSDKNNTRQKSFNRNGQGSGRQQPMEFKQKHRNQNYQNQHSSNDFHEKSRNSQNNTQLNDHYNKNASSSNKGQLSQYNKSTQQQQQQQHQIQNETHNYKQQDQGFHQQVSQQQEQHEQSGQQQQHQHQSRQALAPKTLSSSNLSQRLQQAQNRNDPSHVGSVQIHSLATNQQTNNMIMSTSQQQHAATMQVQVQQQQPQQQIPQEQRGPPKRYSSMRRTQHESQHIPEHQLQQIHIQQQQQAQSAPIILQDQQQLLQANLMQLYHTDNLAQMQALQIGPQAPQGQSKPQTYAAVPPSAPAQPTPTTYYVPADAYAATAAVQQAAGYIPTAAPNAAPLGYASPPLTVTASGPGPYVPTSAVSPPSVAPTHPQGPPNPGAGSNYPNYQNYPSTVGGTTYFVPPVQTTSRPVSMPQRRPTNAIPILPPSEKNKQQLIRSTTTPTDTKEDPKAAPIGSAENIDHIIDNMFVQRPAFQPPQSAGSTASSTTSATTTQPRKSVSPPTGDISSGNSQDTPIEDVGGSNLTENIETPSENSNTSNISSAAIAHE